jgi:nitrogen-specific signal transduction histidine kinase
MLELRMTTAIGEPLGNSKVSIAMGITMIVIVIVALLMTRQLLDYNHMTGNILFIITIVMCYGIGSFVLLSFAHKVSRELRSKSHLSNLMHWTVIILQFGIFITLVIMLLFGNPEYILSKTIFTASSLLATVIMLVIAFKFFSWYRASKFKNPIVLFYALAALTLACSIFEDASTKLLMVQIIYEGPIPDNQVVGSSFQYKGSEKYDGQVVFVETKLDETALFIIPQSYLELYNYLNSIILPVGFIFRWVASTMLLRDIYKKIGTLPIYLWIIISLPLVLYLIGKMPGFFSGESLAGIDEAYRYYFRILFRVGTIGGNILFGLAFFIVAKKLKSSKVRDYLILAGLGNTIVGISLSTSAIEPTFGVAAHSLVLLSTYLFTLGLYSSAITVSQEMKLRQSIKDSAIEESKLLVSIGSAQMVQEIEKKVFAVVEKEKAELTRHTGLQPSFTELDTRKYLNTVLKEIKIIQNIEDIISKSKSILSDSKEFILCTRPSGLRLAYNNYFEIYQQICGNGKMHTHNGIKIITSITDSNDIEIVNKFLALGVSIKHVKNLPPINFAASEKEMIATIQKTEGGQILQNLLTTNEPAYIEHFNSIFSELWGNGIDIKNRINDIETGVDNEGIEIIQNPETFEKIFYRLIMSAKEDIVGIFSTPNAFRRQKFAGTFELIRERLETRTLNVRILVPADKLIYQTINEYEDQGISDRIKIRLMEPSMQTKVSIVVIDKKYSLAVELKDDSKYKVTEAIGLVTYSNSKSTVLSYYSIFESLWKQTELYKQLKLNERMHKEFINIAAHELRTPIQPILGAVDILINNTSGSKEKELVEIVSRNARRLKKLAEDILDVTKLEGYSLNLNKEKFKIRDIILENIHNYESSFEKNKIEIRYNQIDDLQIFADKGGISRVFSNLIDNSIKFLPSTGGFITVTVSLTKSQNEDKPRDMVQVNITDNGTGIDREILPKLFTKFASKSLHGIGLGLFISKSIIEAHGGRIWAENNLVGQGATFSFVLPFGKTDESNNTWT